MDEQKDTPASKGETCSEAPPTTPLTTNPPPSQPTASDKANEAIDKISKSDKIMIAATIVIAAGTLVSAAAIVFQWHEMHTGGLDTKTIADAAKKQACAADKSAQAARDFADTAALINGGMTDAVTKLQTQADETKTLATNALTQARATHELVVETVAEARPWIGVSVSVSGFQLGGTPEASFALANSGKRPARLTRVRFAYAPLISFPESPPFVPGDEGSTAIAVPGGGSTTSLPIDPAYVRTEAIAMFNAARKGENRVFVYGMVDYEDVSSRIPHWTKVCVMYIPQSRSTKAGFVNCPTYNDAN